MTREITFTNWVRIEGQRIQLDDLTEEQQKRVAEGLIYRPLATIANATVVRTV